MTEKSRTSLIPAIAMAGLMIPAQAWAADEFDGPYGGISAGAGIVKQDGALFAGPFENTSTALSIGGILGVRTSLGNDSGFVIGVEGDVNYYSSGSDWRYGVYGIAGFKVSDSGLLYVRGGYSKLDGFGFDEDLDGLVFGGGYEFAFSKSLNLRFDYKNMDYGNVNFPDNIVNSNGHEISAAVIYKF